MSQVMLEDADSQLAHLMEQVRRGEEVIVLSDSTLVAKLVPLPEEKPKERQYRVRRRQICADLHGG